jgi:hypothetical protein
MTDTPSPTTSPATEPAAPTGDAPAPDGSRTQGEGPDVYDGSEIEKMWVQPAAQHKASGMVVLFERHPAHPDGEAFIGGDGPAVEVAKTPAVMAKLDAGDLEEAEAPAPPAPPS